MDKLKIEEKPKMQQLKTNDIESFRERFKAFLQEGINNKIVLHNIVLISLEEKPDGVVDALLLTLGDDWANVELLTEAYDILSEECKNNVKAAKEQIKRDFGTSPSDMFRDPVVEEKPEEKKEVFASVFDCAVQLKNGSFETGRVEAMDESHALELFKEQLQEKEILTRQNWITSSTIVLLEEPKAEN